MTILATIGTLTSQALLSQAQDPDGRLKTLKLQKTAVEGISQGGSRQGQGMAGHVDSLGRWLAARGGVLLCACSHQASEDAP